jgi:hypothetical protein
MEAAANYPLLRVCSLLNSEGANYLVIGGRACILHGIVRLTQDVDILIEPTEQNCRRVLTALSRLEDGAARELTPRDLLENVVVKIADEVEVDVSTHAGKVDYGDARPSALETVIDGVRIPYLSLDKLIETKSTYGIRTGWTCSDWRNSAAVSERAPVDGEVGLNRADSRRPGAMRRLSYREAGPKRGGDRNSVPLPGLVIRNQAVSPKGSPEPCEDGRLW